MPYSIKLSKVQREQWPKEIMQKLKTLESSQLKKAQEFMDKMKEYQLDKVIGYDEYLTIVRAVILKDENAEKIIQEVMTKNQLEFDLEKAISEFLKTKILPKTNPKERLEILKIGQEQILDRKRMMITQNEGEDPNPIFLGKSEDGTVDIYEVYVKCRECNKVFKTYQNQTFCSSSCRRNWFSKHMYVLNEIEEKIEAENNAETWNWERIGNRSDVDLGIYGIFRRVYKND